MNVLKANSSQYNELDGYSFKNSVLQFDKDINDNWIVGMSVLNDDAFIAIRTQLQQLEQIEFNPVITEI